jgi:hypothetical protein
MAERNVLGIPNPDLMLRGQPYWRIGSEPYECKDGRLVTLTVWLSFCADCGGSFACRSMPEAEYLNRRCDLHKRQGVRVGGKADRKRRAEAKAEAEDLVDNKRLAEEPGNRAGMYPEWEYLADAANRVVDELK